VRTLRVRKIARREIDSAFEWHLARSPQAAQRFLTAVDHALAAITESPERNPVVRRCSCSR
jgi:plasmid stabilization system protein ParE